MFERWAPVDIASSRLALPATMPLTAAIWTGSTEESLRVRLLSIPQHRHAPAIASAPRPAPPGPLVHDKMIAPRSEEHTSELQSLMRISYAVFCLKKKTTHLKHKHTHCSPKPQK